MEIHFEKGSSIRERDHIIVSKHRSARYLTNKPCKVCKNVWAYSGGDCGGKLITIDTVTIIILPKSVTDTHKHCVCHYITKC